MAIRNWSTTPASNISAPPNGWPENQAPSTVNDCARQMMADIRTQCQDMEWFDWGDTPSRASATTFKIATDVTSRYLVNRRMKLYDASTLYATITASSYSAPDTTVTISLDSGSTSASLTSVALAIFSSTNLSIPQTLYNENRPINDTNGNELVKFGATASAVNEVTVTNAATGNAPSIAATGGDTNISITVKGKGTGAVKLGQATSTEVRLEADQPITDSSGNEYLKFSKIASAVNELTISNNITGSGPFISSSGGDTNVALNFITKGSGAFQFLGNAGGPTNIVMTNSAQTGSVGFKCSESATFNSSWILPSADGSSGQVLQTNGSGVWSFVNAGKRVLIGSASASNSATVDFTGLALSAYSEVLIIGANIVPQTNATNLYCRVSSAASFISSAGTYRHQVLRTTSAASGSSGSTSDTQVIVNSTSETLSTTSDQIFNFQMHWFHPSNTTDKKHCLTRFSQIASSGNTVTGVGAGQMIGSNTAIDGFRFLMSSGNIVSGLFYVYGLKNT